MLCTNRPQKQLYTLVMSIVCALALVLATACTIKYVPVSFSTVFHLSPSFFVSLNFKKKTAYTRFRGSHLNVNWCTNTARIINRTSTRSTIAAAAVATIQPKVNTKHQRNKLKCNVRHILHPNMRDLCEPIGGPERGERARVRRWTHAHQIWKIHFK